MPKSKVKSLLWMYGVLVIYSLQDALHLQVIPNTPLIFITVACIVTFLSGIRYGMVGFATFLAYYFVHFIVEGHSYPIDKLQVTAIIFICTPIILYLFYLKDLRHSYLETQLNRYHSQASDVNSEIKASIVKLEEQTATNFDQQTNTTTPNTTDTGDTKSND